MATACSPRRRIRKGTAVIEYLGERVSHDEADERYEDKIQTDNHTFLFTVDEKTVIDAGVNGNEARFINHGCDPNCESVDIEQARLHRGDTHHTARRGARLRLSD